jgi:hypothetical protein
MINNVLTLGHAIDHVPFVNVPALVGWGGVGCGGDAGC